MMLNRHDIDATVVYGEIPGIGLHDSVQVHVGLITWVIDRWSYPGFEVQGYGLHPREYIVASP